VPTDCHGGAEETDKLPKADIASGGGDEALTGMASAEVVFDHGNVWPRNGETCRCGGLADPQEETITGPAPTPRATEAARARCKVDGAGDEVPIGCGKLPEPPEAAEKLPKAHVGGCGGDEVIIGMAGVELMFDHCTYVWPPRGERNGETCRCEEMGAPCQAMCGWLRLCGDICRWGGIGPLLGLRMSAPCLGAVAANRYVAWGDWTIVWTTD